MKHKHIPKRIAAFFTVFTLVLALFASDSFKKLTVNADTTLSIDPALKTIFNNALHVENASADITVEQLATLTDLTIEEAYGNAISDYSALSYCSNLQRLTIRSSTMTSVPNLQNLSKLEYLALFTTNLTDLSALPKNSKIRIYTGK